MHLILLSKKEWTFSTEVMMFMKESKSTFSTASPVLLGEKESWDKNILKEPMAQQVRYHPETGEHSLEPNSDVTQLQPPTYCEEAYRMCTELPSVSPPHPCTKAPKIWFDYYLLKTFFKITKLSKTKTKKKKTFTKPQYSFKILQIKL